MQMVRLRRGQRGKREAQCLKGGGRQRWGVRSAAKKDSNCQIGRSGWLDWQACEAHAERPPLLSFSFPESRSCARNLKNLREGNSPAVVRDSMNNLCALAETKAPGIVCAICKYRQSIHKVGPARPKVPCGGLVAIVADVYLFPTRPSSACHRKARLSEGGKGGRSITQEHGLGRLAPRN